MLEQVTAIHLQWPNVALCKPVENIQKGFYPFFYISNILQRHINLISFCTVGLCVSHVV